MSVPGGVKRHLRLTCDLFAYATLLQLRARCGKLPGDQSGHARQEPMPTITVATPVHGQPTLAHMNSLTPLMALQPYHAGERSWRVAHATASNPVIDFARNTLAHWWLKRADDDDRLLFIDADVSFGWESVIALAETDFPLVGGAYRAKQKPVGKADHDYVVSLLTGTHDIKKGCIPVDGLGAGFLMMRREVFLAMAKAHPRELYIADKGDSKGVPMFDYFQCRRFYEDHAVVSEDYFFCRRAKEVGFETMMLLDCPLGHTGPYTHTGNIKELLCGS